MQTTCCPDKRLALFGSTDKREMQARLRGNTRSYLYWHDISISDLVCLNPFLNDFLVMKTVCWSHR